MSISVIKCIAMSTLCAYSPKTRMGLLFMLAGRKGDYYVTIQKNTCINTVL